MVKLPRLKRETQIFLRSLLTGRNFGKPWLNFYGRESGSVFLADHGSFLFGVEGRKQMLLKDLLSFGKGSLEKFLEGTKKP